MVPVFLLSRRRRAPFAPAIATALLLVLVASPWVQREKVDKLTKLQYQFEYETSYTFWHGLMTFSSHVMGSLSCASPD
jgi:hypothetical protein